MHLRSFVLAEEDGIESRSVTMTLDETANIRLHTYDEGPTAERVWGTSEYEFWVEVPLSSFVMLHARLMKDRPKRQMATSLNFGGVNSSIIEMPGDSPGQLLDRIWHLLLERYLGDLQAVERFTEVCIEAEIPHRKMAWS